MPQATFLFTLKSPMRFSASTLRLPPTRRSVSSGLPYSAGWGVRKRISDPAGGDRSKNQFAARPLSAAWL